MNFSWEMVLFLMEKGTKKEEIFFKQAEEYSPYYEQAFEDINQKDIDNNLIEMNGFFRFWEVFGELLSQNNSEALEFKDYLFDIIMHYLVEIDLRKGISKRGIYIMKLHQELSSGNYGEEIGQQFVQMSIAMRHELCDYLLTQFQIGSSVFLFSRAIRLVFPKGIVYKNNLNIKQLLVYVGERESKEIKRKSDMVKSLFLPMGYSLRFFYEHHFGILDVDETLELGDIEIF